MRFEWDDQKSVANVRKHGFSLADAHLAFSQPMVVREDARGAYGERRWVGVGQVLGRAVVVVWTEPDEETIRIISMRRALKHERLGYEREITDRLG